MLYYMFVTNYVILCYISYEFMITSVGLLVHFVEQGILSEDFC
jgi:hypothetical protein